MKTRFFTIALLIIVGITECSESALAQTTIDTLYGMDITVGPFFTAGASGAAGTVATGTKTDYRFAWSAGALGLFPVSYNVSLALGLGYDSRGINYHPQDDASQYNNYVFNYFAIQPSIKFKDFFVGATIGIPMSASVTTPSATTSVSDLSTVNTLVEARIGGMIEIDKSKTGVLRLIVFGAYPFTKIVNGTGLFNPSHDGDKNNGPFTTAQLGVSYLFDVAKH